MIKKAKCEGCKKLRLLITHNIINIITNLKVGTIDICLSCASKMMNKGKLVIEE